MAGHWDSVYLARGVPLARGWLRQTDVRLNDAVFYRRRPTPTTYRTFLLDNAVQYVALPDAELTQYGRDERALIDTNLPYLADLAQRALDGVRGPGRGPAGRATGSGAQPAARTRS